MSGGAPSVSVAIWTCDQARFIGEAIASAVEQEYPRLEVVVADDNSSDETPRIVREYADRYPDLVKPILHQGPRSVAANVNRALEACSGDLVAILDGDDAFLPGKIEAQVAAFRANPQLAICRHPVERMDVESRRVGIEDPCPRLEWADVHDLVAIGYFVPTASSMMRRSAIPDAGVPPVVEWAPDWLLAIEAARHGPILRLASVLARYRIHPDQFTAPRAGSERVYADAVQTLDHVRASYPELAQAAKRSYPRVARWEAERRRASADLAWRREATRAAVRLAPWSWRAWRLHVAVLTSAAWRALARRFDRD